MGSAEQYTWQAGTTRERRVWAANRLTIWVQPEAALTGERAQRRLVPLSPP